MLTPPPALMPVSRSPSGGASGPYASCMRWSSLSSADTGRKVPAPPCSVSVSVAIPASVRREIRSGVKCSAAVGAATAPRSEEHTSELQSLMRISYAVFCLKKKKNTNHRSIQLQTQHNTDTTSSHMINRDLTQREISISLNKHY